MHGNRKIYDYEVEKNSYESNWLDLEKNHAYQELTIQKTQFHDFYMIFHDQQCYFHDYLMHDLQPPLLAASSQG